MVTILVGGILTLVLMAAASRVMFIRSLAKLECRSCATKFGWRSVLHNKIVIRVLSVTWDDKTPFFSRNIESGEPSDGHEAADRLVRLLGYLLAVALSSADDCVDLIA